jgi:hypothetical protein
MARQLERVLADAPQRQALADQALIRAKDFDGMRCVHTMETTYEKIMSGK